MTNPSKTAHARLLFLVGAHKTATSHLQQSLLAAQDLIRPHGIVLVGPKMVRQDLTPLSSLLRNGTTPQIAIAGAQGFLEYYGGDAAKIVVMDENIFGSTDRKMLMRKSRLYPWASHRLERILSLFPDHEIEIGLATRNMATFLPSCWSESLLHGPYHDFQAFIKDVDVAIPFWSGLVERLKTVRPNIQLTLWRYEDYQSLLPALLAHVLTPEAAKEVTPKDRVFRRGISSKAAHWLQDQKNHDKHTIAAARKKFPKTEAKDAHIPWSDAELEAMSLAYEKDLAALQADKDIHLLTP